MENPPEGSDTHIESAQPHQSDQAAEVMSTDVPPQDHEPATAVSPEQPPEESLADRIADARADIDVCMPTRALGNDSPENTGKLNEARQRLKLLYVEEALAESGPQAGSQPSDQ